MAKQLPLVLFTLDEQQYALHCAQVRRILQVVAIAPVPNMPKDLLGVINVEGEIITVINIRERLALPQSLLSLKDFIIIAESPIGIIGFVVNDINFIKSANHDIEKQGSMQIIKSSKGMVYILDLQQIFNEKNLSILSVTASNTVMPGLRQEKK